MSVVLKEKKIRPCTIVHLFTYDAQLFQREEHEKMFSYHVRVNEYQLHWRNVLTMKREPGDVLGPTPNRKFEDCEWN